MYNLDLENLYSRINGHILLIGSYIQNPTITSIIRSCRLKPYSIFKGEFKAGTRFENHWVDEFGNSLKFNGTNPHILVGDTEIVSSTKISTDLFFGNSINKTIENSKFIFIANGKYISEDIYILALYGQDEYFRTFIYNREWFRISPLLLGINTLLELYKHIDILRLTEIDKKRLDFVLNFEIDKCMAASSSLKKDMVSKFNDEIITNIL